MRKVSALLAHPNLSDCSQRGLGYTTLFEFLHNIYTTKDQYMSSQVSQMVGHHVHELLNFIKERDGTGKTAEWIKESFGRILEEEVEEVTKLLRPQRGGDVSNVLEMFSLSNILTATKLVAPNLRELVSDLLGYEEGEVSKQKKDVVSFFTPLHSPMRCHSFHQLIGSCHRVEYLRPVPQREVQSSADGDRYLPVCVWSVKSNVRCAESRWLQPIVHADS
jgi:hypothetical protein